MISELKNEETIYYAAVEKAVAERRAYLKSACGEDREFLARIEGLLRVHEQRGDFMEAPVIEAEVTLAEMPLTEVPGTVIGKYVRIYY